MSRPLILLAGSTGKLGTRIAAALVRRGGRVRALVRPSSEPEAIAAVRDLGVEVVTGDYGSATSLSNACSNVSCVISALSGLREVIVEAQSTLLDAAVAAGVPRFIPSDYAIDFVKQPEGWNRNLDLRREFHERLDRAPIAATSILNGMFTDMLTGQAPIVLFKFKRVMYWENADQPMDFTTIDDTAEYAAAAALDASTPRYLRIAGDTVTARELVEIASDVTGQRFRLFRGGGLRRLERLVKIMRTIVPGRTTLYPPWQGMQYLHNMFSGRAQLVPLDNDRYAGIRWTTVREVLATRE